MVVASKESDDCSAWLRPVSHRHHPSVAPNVKDVTIDEGEPLFIYGISAGWKWTQDLSFDPLSIELRLFLYFVSPKCGELEKAFSAFGEITQLLSMRRPDSWQTQ